MIEVVLGLLLLTAVGVVFWCMAIVAGDADECARLECETQEILATRNGPKPEECDAEVS
jgi:hypothetical protein